MCITFVSNNSCRKQFAIYSIWSICNTTRSKAIVIVPFRIDILDALPPALQTKRNLPILWTRNKMVSFLSSFKVQSFNKRKERAWRFGQAALKWDEKALDQRYKAALLWWFSNFSLPRKVIVAFYLCSSAVDVHNHAAASAWHEENTSFMEEECIVHWGDAWQCWQTFIAWLEAVYYFRCHHCDYVYPQLSLELWIAGVGFQALEQGITGLSQNVKECEASQNQYRQ